MALINDKDRDQLRAEFEKLVRPVKLVLFVDDENCTYCAETQKLLEEIASLSPELALETYHLQSDMAKAAESRPGRHVDSTGSALGAFR